MGEWGIAYVFEMLRIACITFISGFVRTMAGKFSMGKNFG
jgi:hypothetical protein